MGPFRKCTCSAPRWKRSFRFEGFLRNGHKVGAASIVIHEGGCMGSKGGNKPQVWLFKCGGSTVAKIDHNNYIHPHADHSGRFSMGSEARRYLETYTANGNWEAAINLIKGQLVLVKGDSGHTRLGHFPTISKPQRRPKNPAIASRFVQGFTVRGKLLGPYFIDLFDASKTYCDVRLRGGNHTAVAWKNGAAQANLHPHTCSDGRLDISPIAPEMGAIAPTSPDEALFLIERYLKTGIQDSDAYLKLEHWPNIAGE